MMTGTIKSDKKKFDAHEKIVRPLDKIVRTLMYIILLGYCVSLLIPLIWMIFTSFKSYGEYYTNTFLWPQKWIFGNFGGAYERMVITVIKGKNLVAYNVLDMALISILYATGTSFLHVLIVTMVSYVISRYKFFGRDFLYALGIFVMVTPIIGSSVSTMVVRRALGIYDNMLLTMLTSQATSFSGLHFMLMYAAFKRIPKSFAEAAFMDGGGHYTVLFRIMLPMILPLCTVIFVLSFLGYWNDYGTFLIWLPSYPSLSYGMFLFQSNATLYGATINEVMAGFSFVMIPTMMLFLSSQKLIVSKFSVGGLKG